MPKYYDVKNKLGISLHLSDAAGDSTQVPPLSTHTVEARFIEFQLPPLSHAEVIGYDYAKRFNVKTASAPAPEEKEAEPAPLRKPGSDIRQ